MKVSDYIVKFLESCDIEYVFGYQGGMITHLVDSLSKSRKVKFVQCYHEQSAAFAAEGYARESGKFGVCITTSGPGATNTVTGIGNAYFDSVPVLYITGQVNTHEYKYESKIRQRGFQETDIVSIVGPIVKSAKLADDPLKVARILEESVRMMLSGRKGPVLIDLPMDVQRHELSDDSELPCCSCRTGSYGIEACDIRKVLDALNEAERPLVICGGGLSGSGARSAAAAFLKRTRIPYAVSLMGKGSVSEDEAGFAGMIGSYGNRVANLVFSESDLVLCFGTRLDLRQTGNRESALLKKIRFIRIDVDGRELEGNPLPNQMCVHADVSAFLESSAVMECGYVAPVDWCDRVAHLKKVRSQREDVRLHAQNRTPYTMMETISSCAPDDAIFFVDIGQNQMWAAQMLKCGSGRGFMTSGGMAPMGYAVPAAVGASFANPRRRVICICGDGGLHISLQSLMLISQYRLPVTVIVFNNRALGMITQFQNLYFGGNLAGTTESGGYCVPDFKHIALAYQLNYRHIGAGEVITSEMLEERTLVEIDVGERTVVVPKLEFNKTLDDMTPAWSVSCGGR